MLQNIKKIKLGFTLIELLVGIAIIGVLSVVALRMIFNIVNYRSKQFAIEDTSDSFRSFISEFSYEVRSSGSVTIPSTDYIEISRMDSCTSYHYNGVTIERSDSDSGVCNTSYAQVLQNNIKITEFTPVIDGDFINISIKGVYSDSIGSRDFTYKTSVTKRI